MMMMMMMMMMMLIDDDDDDYNFFFYPIYSMNLQYVGCDLFKRSHVSSSYCSPE